MWNPCKSTNDNNVQKNCEGQFIFQTINEKKLFLENKGYYNLTSNLLDN